MYHHIKLALAGLTAALLMAAAVGTASARSFSVTNKSFRAVWSPLRFFGEGGIEGELRCPVTLEGSFNESTIAKVVGAVIGSIARATSGAGAACARGSSTIPQETLPWRVTYEGFTGPLPRITQIRLLLIGFAFRIDPGIGIACRYGHATENAADEINVGANGEANSLTADNTIRLRGFGEFGCPPEIGFEGTTSSFTLQGNTTRITIRLI